MLRPLYVQLRRQAVLSVKAEHERAVPDQLMDICGICKIPC